LWLRCPITAIFQAQGLEEMESTDKTKPLKNVIIANIFLDFDNFSL
jgi:hypothetical protein